MVFDKSVQKRQTLLIESEKGNLLLLLVLLASRRCESVQQLVQLGLHQWPCRRILGDSLSFLESVAEGVLLAQEGHEA